MSRILLTGASRGIGAELARELFRRGHDLVLVARSSEALAATAAALEPSRGQPGGAVERFPFDLVHTAGLGDLVARIEAGGPVDVLVNNAGVELTGSMARLDPERIAHLLTLNLTVPLLLTRAVLPGMLARGDGHIVNVSSLSGTNSIPGLVPYSASKAGLSHATAVLRADLRSTAISTTLVEIGPVRSEMMDSLRHYGPTRRAVQRLARLRLTYDLPVERVVRAISDAVEDRRRHVRLPRRDALFPLLSELPRRMSEILLTGVDHRPD